MTGDVTDDEDERAAVDRERVVPVTADVDGDVRGPVHRGQLAAGDRGQALRDDGLLQHLDHVVLGRELELALLPELRPFERGRGPATEVGRELEVGVAERDRVVVADEHDAARPARDVHRDDDAGHGPQPVEECDHFVVPRVRVFRGNEHLLERAEGRAESGVGRFHDHVAAADTAIDEVLERRLQRAVGVRDRGLAQRAVRLARVHDREAADARGREARGCVQDRFGVVDARRAARRSRAACAAAPGCVVRLRAATRARAPARTLPRPRRCTGDRRR